MGESFEFKQINEKIRACAGRRVQGRSFMAVISAVQLNDPNEPIRVNRIPLPERLANHGLDRTGEITAVRDQASALMAPSRDEGGFINIVVTRRSC